MNRREIAGRLLAGAVGALGGGRLMAGLLRSPARPPCCACGRPSVGKRRRFGVTLWYAGQAHALLYPRYLCARPGCRTWLCQLITLEGRWYSNRVTEQFGDWEMAMTGDIEVTPL